MLSYRGSLRCIVFLVVVLLCCGGCGTPEAPNPTIAITPSGGPIGTIFTVTGTGFTPGGSATVHQLTSEQEVTFGGDVPPQGKIGVNFTTAGRDVGSTELWVVDDASTKSSNHVTYTLTAQ